MSNSYSNLSHVPLSSYFVYYDDSSKGLAGLTDTTFAPITPLLTKSELETKLIELGVINTYLTHRHKDIAPSPHLHKLMARLKVEEYKVNTVNNRNRHPYIPEFGNNQYPNTEANVTLAPKFQRLSRRSLFYNILLANDHFLTISRREGWSTYTTKEWFQHRHYMASDTGYVLLKTEDVFNPNKSEVLYNIMLEEVNKTQLFGINCVNLPAQISGLQQNYRLKEDGIEFYSDYSSWPKILFLSTEQLEPALTENCVLLR